MELIIINTFYLLSGCITVQCTVIMYTSFILIKTNISEDSKHQITSKHKVW